MGTVPRGGTGTYELARRVLAHKNLQTTINADVGFESLEAARLFARIALGEDDVS